MIKDFKTISQQVEILKNKGLIIDDIEKAENILLKENYFFLNGYRHLFMNSASDRTFVTGATFDELYSLFLFDRYSRNIFFKNLLIIENRLKSIISYQLSKRYGYKEKDYLNYKNFTGNPEKRRRVKDIVDKMKRQIRINASRHSATMHYLNNYGYIEVEEMRFLNLNSDQINAYLDKASTKKIKYHRHYYNNYEFLWYFIRFTYWTTIKLLCIKSLR